MLIFVMPARTAAAIPSSGTPDEPCSTSGTSTAARIRAIRSRSSWAVRSVIACELPTATARASTPVSWAKAAASSGLVRTPGACTPSLPPISPSSASTLTPAAWQRSATVRVTARLSASSRREPSNITEVNPRPSASSTSGSLTAWSRCRTTGTLARSASTLVAAATGASEPWKATVFSLIWSTTGRPTCSAAAVSASACSRWMTLNAATPRPAARAVCSTSWSGKSTVVLLG